MRKLLISTTALSVAISPLPGFAQSLNDDGSITGADGSTLCIALSDPGCDIAAIIEGLNATDPAAAEALQAQVEARIAADAAAAEAAAAEAQAAQAAEEAAAAEAAAQAEADAKAAADAEAAAAAEAAAQAEAEAAAAEAEAQAQAEADAAAAQAAEEAAAAEAAAQAEAEAQAQAEAEVAAQAAADDQAAADAAAAEAAAAEAAAQAAADDAAAAAESTVEDPAVMEESVAEEPVVEDPAVTEEPAGVEEPAAEEPVAEEPMVEDPAATEEPAGVEEPAAEEPVAEEPVAEEPVAEEPVAEDPVAEEPVAEEPVVTEDPAASADTSVEAGIDPATGEPVDPAAAAAALAAAEAELAISEGGEIVDPAAGLKVAEPDPALLAEPVEAPVVTETEVESLTQLLTTDPTAINPTTLEAASLVPAEPLAEGEALPEPAADNLVATVTETITDANARSSAEEFAAAPTALGDGKKSGLSDLEKAGLLVLGALAVGAIIKNNRAAAATDTTVSTMGPGDSRVVSNTGDRVIVLQPDGTYRVLKDDDTVIRRPGSTVRTETFRDGSTRTIVERADGTQVVTIRDATGRVLRRATYDDIGREIVLIDDLEEEEVVIIRDLPKPKKRIVISSKDDDTALKRELAALEADSAGRKFSLRQIREIPQVRALAATIDVEPVTFATGSAAIPAAEARDLADLGRVMQELLDENPREVFLIEGHTDATGKAALNLALSDRRAESVALALTEYFDIPPENMVVQGYGETELLIDTLASEARNRRVEVRVITPLLRTADRG